MFEIGADAGLGPPRVLTTLAADVSALAWTADGRELIFRRAANVPLPLARVRVDEGSPPVNMPWTGADAVSPAVGANGRLAFARNVRDTNIWRLTVDDPDRAGSLRQLASSSFREVHPQYSPDGTRLVFHSNRSGSIQVWIADADGSRATQLTSMEPFATTGSPRWSRDGLRVLFDSNATGVYQVYEISADGGAPKALTSGVSNSFGASDAPDGRSIYFSSDRSGRQEVWRMAPGGAEPEQVTRNGGSNPVLTADGAWIYFIKEGGSAGLWRLPAAGGGETRVLDMVYRWNFALTPTGIYFASRPFSSASSSEPVVVQSTIRFLDQRTGTIRDVLAVDKLVDLGLSLSPDGKYLLFTKLDYTGTDLMLVEHFR